MLQYLGQVRIVGRHQRAPLQLREVRNQPEADKRSRHRDELEYSPAQVQVTSRILEVRLNEPGNVRMRAIS